ncbi:MAG: DPP IV N-terminal domain-containing protein, partial [Rikenellaceae bacterium]|nr:DPP IV N-terminal domain-containing protein [Rikenellaceae bacterium]
MRKLMIFSSILATMTILNAQPRFTYDDLASGGFAQRSVYGLRSMNDGEHYTTQERDKIIRYSYRTGEAVETIFESPQDFGFTAYEFSSDERKILLTTEPEPIYRQSFRARYCIFDRDTKQIQAISPGGKQQVASFSPDGRKVAFVRDNNLFYVTLEDRIEVQVTTDGRFNHIINGVPDWVYEEEFGFSQAYQWSPESDRIAFMRFDESRVKEFHMNMFERELYPTVYTFKYPKAGEENSIVTVYSYDLTSGQTYQMDTGTETDQYIPRIQWTPDERLALFRLNRLQNHFQLLLADPITGTSTVIYEQQDERYIERVNDETVTFLADGKRFIVKNEADGFAHLYLYSIEKGLIDRITRGEWEVTQLLGVDEPNGKLYYMSCETSPLRRNLYSIRLDGKGKERLTRQEGTYRIAFSKGYNYYISYFSNAASPLTVTLHGADGKVGRVLEDYRLLREKIREMNVPKKEF